MRACASDRAEVVSQGIVPVKGTPETRGFFGDRECVPKSGRKRDSCLSSASTRIVLLSWLLLGLGGSTFVLLRRSKGIGLSDSL